MLPGAEFQTLDLWSHLHSKNHTTVPFINGGILQQRIMPKYLETILAWVKDKNV